MKIVKLSISGNRRYAIQEKGIKLFGIQLTSDTYYSQDIIGAKFPPGSWEFWEFCVRTLETTKQTYDRLNPRIVEEIDYE